MVLLSDWWLVKAGVERGGKKLGVGGIEEGPDGLRIFTSAPIIKRFRANSVETADGITVLMCGLINKWRSRDNGFPLEVGEQFLVGFPNNWEACANRFFAKESPRQQDMKHDFEVADTSSKGGDHVDDNREHQSCSVSSFPCNESEEILHGTYRCNTANSAQDSFLTQSVQYTVKDEINSTSPMYIQQDHHKPLESTVKKEECELSTFEDSVIQGSYSCPNTRKTFASLEKLNLRKSRSGRVLIPCLNAGSQSVVYDSDGAVSGILTDVDDYASLLRGEKTNPPRKKRKKHRQ